MNVVCVGESDSDEGRIETLVLSIELPGRLENQGFQRF